MKLRLLVNIVAGATLALSSALLAVAPAQAAARDGVCDAGEFCYYYNTGPAGSVSDFATSVANYGTNPATCYVFKTPGLPGYNQCIKNNAAAVKNLSSQTVRIFYNSGNAGSYLDIAPGTALNLKGTALYNNNASHLFTGSPTPPTPQPPASGGSLTNPYPAAWGPNGGWTARSAWLRDTIKARFGLSCTTYATSDTTSEHSNGNAMDCWGDVGTRRTLQYWVAANARSLKVWYVIHEQRIFSLTYPTSGWRLMADRGSATQNHMDHVHISLQTPAKQF